MGERIKDQGRYSLFGKISPRLPRHFLTFSAILEIDITYYTLKYC
jgi:hypothetical protein